MINLYKQSKINFVKYTESQFFLIGNSRENDLAVVVAAGSQSQIEEKWK